MDECTTLDLQETYMLYTFDFGHENSSYDICSLDEIHS